MNEPAPVVPVTPQTTRGPQVPAVVDNPAVSLWAEPAWVQHAADNAGAPKPAGDGVSTVAVPDANTTDWDESVQNDGSTTNVILAPHTTEHGEALDTYAQVDEVPTDVLTAQIQTGDKPSAALVVDTENGNTATHSAVTVNSSSLTSSQDVTTTNGNTAITNGTSTTGNLNGTFSQGSYQQQVITTEDGKETVKDQSQYTYGFGSFGWQGSHAESMQKDGETVDDFKMNGGASVDILKGEAAMNGGFSQDGVSGGGGLSYDKDGWHANLHGGIETEDAKFGVTAEFDKNSTTVGFEAGTDNVQVGLTFHTEHGDVKQEPHTEPDAISAMLGDQPYLTSTRTDSTTVGGSLAIDKFGASGSVTQGSGFQMIETLPSNWGSMKQDEKTKYQTEREEARDYGKMDSLADVPLEELKDGQGFRYTGYSGWNGSAGISYGGFSVSGGIGQNSANDVLVVRDDGMLTVSMTRQDGMTSDMAVGMSGVGINFANSTSDAHNFQFTVDPNNKDAMKELDHFMDTGLLPGTGQLTDPDAQKSMQRFEDAQKDVSQLNLDLAAAKTMEDKEAILLEIGNAQSQMEINRNYLNDQWAETYGVNSTPLGKDGGILITQETKTHEETSAVGGDKPGGGFAIYNGSQTWVDQEHLAADGTSAFEATYEREDGTFGQVNSSQGAGMSTDPDHIAFELHSNNELMSPETASIIGNIENSDLPSYVLDDWAAHGHDVHLFSSWIIDNMAGETKVALDQTALNAMTTNLNDMKNPESVDMWNDMASRSAAYLGKDSFMLPSPTGDSQDDAAMANSADYARMGFLNDITTRDPTKDPLAGALAEYKAGDPWAALELAAKDFADVNTPAEFQQLTPNQQQLYLAVVGNTSGELGDPTGQRSSYEALGPASLIKDPQARVDAMRDIFVADNDQSTNAMGDGVWNFIQFAERFKDDDPATYNLIQQSTSFDWKQEDVENVANNKTGAEIQTQFQGSSGGDAFLMIQAANHQGGPAQIASMMTATNGDPQALVQSLANDPTRQHMMYDMLVAAGYGAALAGMEVSFPVEQAPPDPNQTSA